MSARHIRIDGHVLLKEDSGESHVRYHVLTGEHGRLTCLARRSTRRTSSALPDLFDSGTFGLDQPASSRAWFIREVEIHTHRSTLARNYKALVQAAEFARTIDLNVAHLELYDPLCEILEGMLNALERGADPATVHLKALFRFASSEGYPVREAWLAQMPEALRSDTVARLRAPSPSAGDTDAAEAIRLLDSLKSFLERETDIRIP